MNISFNASSVKSFLRQLASVVGLIVSIGNQAHLPTSVRAVLASVSGVLLTVDHYVEKTATSATTATPSNPTSTPGGPS